MKKYTINFSFTLNGEQEIYANSKEEAIKEFKYQSFMEVIDNSGAFIDADQMEIDDIYENNN